MLLLEALGFSQELADYACLSAAQGAGMVLLARLLEEPLGQRQSWTAVAVSFVQPAM